MKKRILVVDGTTVMRELIQTLLVHYGYDVYATENGKQAIIFLQAGGMVDAVVASRRMPEIDGEELTRWIKSQRPEIKVIVASCSALGEFEQSVRDAGADGAIDKLKLVPNLPPLLAHIIGQP